MPHLIVIRLHPPEPVDPSEFRTWLSGLTITASDVSVQPIAGRPPLGTASGLANVPALGGNGIVPANARIFQNYVDVFVWPSFVRRLESVATAIIEVNPPNAAPEYPDADHFDIRLDIQRGGQTIVHKTIHFNVDVQNVPLSLSQTVYFAMPANAYVTLPRLGVGLGAGAHVDLPADGTPPSFASLTAAINAVLAQDPGGGATLQNLAQPLTLEMSRVIANEIVWDREYYPEPAPHPEPPFPTNDDGTLGAMYTKPPADSTVNADNAERARMQFEGKLAAYEAIHGAEATRLTGFVFAAAAAVACEKISAAATAAGLTFPLITASSTPTTLPTASVVLVSPVTPPVPLNPSFVVSAAYFYALGAMLPPQVDAAQRYALATLGLERRVRGDLETAIDAAVIAEPSAPFAGPGPAINAHQAAQRIHALGATTGSLSRVPLTAAITPLVTDWLAHAGPTEDINTAFWPADVVAHAGAYLDLVVAAITNAYQPLIAAIKAPAFGVADVNGLVAKTDQDWRHLFLGPVLPPPDPPPGMGLLPPWTEPGTPAERVEAFIRHLHKFFKVAPSITATVAPTLDLPPTIALSIVDALGEFVAQYDGMGPPFPFKFGDPLQPWDALIVDAAIQAVFPDDPQARAWLRQALDTIDALYRVTDIGLAELHVSLIEALYARGFTSAAAIAELTPGDFQKALTGTIAYPYAAKIYALAGGTGGSATPGDGTFTPVNPGQLVDCVPPPHLSPFGPVEYLHQLLLLSVASTCDEPVVIGTETPSVLAEVLNARRGPLWTLLATRSNLETPLPVVDLVLESLEKLAADAPAISGGAVYQTASEQLADHKLAQYGETPSVAALTHDPATLFGALPEHSSPATPVGQPGGYDKLRVDFTAPDLPYPQALDINRTYLGALGSSRFSAMRHFRRDITELALDPAAEPAAFQRHLWRFPVRFETALEYLGISQDEYALLYARDIALVATPGALLLRELYGYPTDAEGGVAWTDAVREVATFIDRTGLTYCELLELQAAGYVEFWREGSGDPLPECQPCCPDDLRIEFVDPADTDTALRMLAVFIRLWRRLQALAGPKISFAQLRDICDVLALFRPDGTINPDFVRQLAAMLMLRELLRLPLYDPLAPVPAGATGAARTHLLALWRDPAEAMWPWAIAELLDKVEDFAEAHHRGKHRPPEFLKLLADNLDALSRLAGFDPHVPADSWHARPTHTLRFAEILAKLYASDFTVNELLYLFTADGHLRGDDPFLLPEPNEALDLPLELPDEGGEHALWSLRRKLLDVDVGEDEVEGWTWPRIDHTLRQELGYAPPPGPDPLQLLGEHFFPMTLGGHGHALDPLRRQFRVSLPTAAMPAPHSPLMWNRPPSGPFHYDTDAEELWLQLPVADEAIVDKLSEIRQLNDAEQAAVRDLYFAPRAMLAPFAMIFHNFDAAVDRLVQEPNEHARWTFFRAEFARFYRRCHVIAEHLAGHVSATTDGEAVEGDRVAWLLLRSLLADENRAHATWEDDGGARPPVTWTPQPNGGAFGALLGLMGTGSVGELTVGPDTVWREMRGPLEAFGEAENASNAPVVTVIPGMGLTLNAAQRRLVATRNGFALRDSTGERLGGAQAFKARWRGTLLIECEGRYTFAAGVPDGEDGARPEREGARWRVTLRRGQRTWIVLNHRWPGEDAPQGHTATFGLRPGAYEIDAEFEEREPDFDREEDVCPRVTGFQVLMGRPGESEDLCPIPFGQLFRDTKDEPIGEGLDPGEQAAAFLNRRYPSSLRDIRRTYQRAFKALLFVHRFRLSTRPAPGDPHVSELSFLLDHPVAFRGASYYRNGGGIAPHYANFDFNFLPIDDPYHPPAAADDQRVAPSAKRIAALFDWWERVFDYCQMRRETRTAIERPAWLLFYEADQHQPDDPAQLLRHLGINSGDAPLVLTYFAAPPYTLGLDDLVDERWAIRTHQAAKWIRAMRQHAFADWDVDPSPYLWASDDPGVVIPTAAETGNEDLTRFVRDGYIESGSPRRYENLKQLNDGLRERARAALVAYLCGMDRVALPQVPGTFAEVSRDLSDLLLQNVDVGLCERASRIEDAVASIHAFVQRARLGLEPGFHVTPAFALLWDRRFATYHVWEMCARHEMYNENTIDWEEVEKARRTEAFQLLESELRRTDLSVPVPGGLEWWPDQRPPIYPSLTVLQSREPSHIKLFETDPLVLAGAYPEGLGLLGTPEHDARPSWLSPIERAGTTRPPDHDGEGVPVGVEHPNDGGNQPVGVVALAEGGGAADHPVGVVALVEGNDGGANPAVGGVPDHRDHQPVPMPMPEDQLPLWIRAPVRLGIRFVRVAAAGDPQAAARFAPHEAGESGSCCVECGRIHEPLVDEYYFWLQDARYYDDRPEDVQQDPDVGKDPTVVVGPGLVMDNPTSDWHRPAKLPSLLYWETHPMVHLHWSRFHNGEFLQPRRSDEGLPYDPDALSAPPQLNFKGRTGDSLRFEVHGGIRPVGYADPTPAGFRYDISTDSAVVLPLIVIPSGPAPTYPSPLTAYPFFVYHTPGATLMPSRYSVALTVAAALRAHCQYEAALKWYELAFKPLSSDNTWAQCPPDHDDDQPETPPGEPITPDHVGPGGNDIRALALVRSRLPIGDVACCPSAPVDDEVARDRAVLLKYLETLLAWGDALVCRNAPEAFRQAWVTYATIDRVLGAHPDVILAQDDETPQLVFQFVPRPAPLNPRLLALYDRTADRLALLQACVGDRRITRGRANIDMPFWGDSPLRNGWESADTVCLDENDWCMTCCDPYRFLYRVQHALQLAGTVRGLGAQLLAAYEKGDAEYLATIRAAQERQLLELGLEVRQNQWRDADWQVQALQKTKEGAQTRQRYYQTLIQNGLIPGEHAYESELGVSMMSRAAGQALEGIAQGIGMMPDIFAGVAGIGGSPLQFNHITGGTKISLGFTIGARILASVADIASTNATLNLTQAGWQRREDEWRHQAEVIGIEVEQIERQILGAERRRDAALRELNNHQRTLENSIEIQTIRRDMFASHELYVFLQQETAAMAYQAYELALYAARRAQVALNYELGYTTHNLLPEGVWDNLHDGMLAGERLELAVRQMERVYQDGNCRELELLKYFSLRVCFPEAFLQLQTTGYCEVELPEWMFDFDYPGHYLRRIKNVRLTIPAVVGPYTGIHCRLTLLSSTTRVDPRPAPPPEACCGDDPSDAYVAQPDDPRFVRSYAATEAIATSTGQEDSGLFELSFHDDRYLPFEFAGAVSRWRIELPPENNQFDFDSLSDVVLHLSFTARDGGAVLRGLANAAARKRLPGAGVRLFDIRHDMPDAWHRLQRGHLQGLLPLALGREHFPFLPADRRLRVTRLELFFETARAQGDGFQTVHFVRQHHQIHGPEEICDCGGYDVTCVASTEWPNLYHGVLDLDLGLLERRGNGELGVFRFPSGPDRPVRAYLLCTYETEAVTPFSLPAEQMVPIAGTRGPWTALPPHLPVPPHAPARAHRR